MYNGNLIRRLQDGGTLLPNLKDIRKAVRSEYDMLELMEENAGGLVPGRPKPVISSCNTAPVFAEEVEGLTDTLKEL